MLTEIRNKLNIVIKSKEFNSTVWNVADVIFLPFVMLLFTPLFIKLLGTEQYGIWMLVNSILVSIGLVNFGIGDATIKFVSKYRAFNDSPNINRIIKSSFAVTLILVILVILLGNILASLLNRYNVLNIDVEYLSLTIISVRIASILFGLKQLEQFFLSIFKGFEQYNVAARISILSKTLLLTGQILAVLYTRSIVNVFIVSVFSGILIVVFEIIFIKIRNRAIPLTPFLSKASLQELFSFGTWAWVQSILGVFVGQADRFIVMALAGAKMLAYYSIASTIAYQIHAIFTTGVSWIFPKVSRKTEKNESTSQLYYKMQILVIISMFSLILVVLLFEKQIFMTWLGNETYSHSINFIKIFLFYTFFTSLSIIPYYYFLGTNLIRMSAYFMFISVILSIVFMVIAYKVTGILGLAYGKVLSSIVAVPLMLVFIHLKIVDKGKVNGAIYIILIVLLLSITLYMNYFLILPLVLLSIFLLKRLYIKSVINQSIK